MFVLQVFKWQVARILTALANASPKLSIIRIATRELEILRLKS